MATLKQQAFVKKLSENISRKEKQSLKEISQESGFSKSMSITPGRILKSKGVKELLLRAGISDSKIIGEWKELGFNKEPEDKFTWDNKIKALQEITEISGIKEPEETKKASIKIFIDKYLQIPDNRKIKESE